MSAKAGTVAAQQADTSAAVAAARQSRQMASSSPASERNNVSSSDLSETDLIGRVLEHIQETSEERLLVYEDISIAAAEAVANHLDSQVESRTNRLSYNSLHRTLTILVMRTLIHDCHQPWIIESLRDMSMSGLLTNAESRSLRLLCGTTFEAFETPYASSRKAPDQCVRPVGCRLPTLVIESGWSESRPHLYRDRDLWLHGGAGFVTVVILIKWTKRSGNRVQGDLEVFDKDSVTGQVQLRQQEIIFPCPPEPIALTQRIPITRQQLFGPHTSGSINSDAVGYLHMNNLREIADEHIRDQGLIPAI